MDGMNSIELIICYLAQLRWGNQMLKLEGHCTTGLSHAESINDLRFYP